MTKVFISYSHDSDEHREWVLGLSERLRADGIETILDRYVKNGSPPEGWPRWMLNSLDAATHVLCVCTETYYRRFRGHEDPGKGKGVDWEGTLITQEIYDARSVSIKFIPVLRGPIDPIGNSCIPEPLRSQTHYVLNTKANYQALCNVLLDQGGVEPGPVGPPKIKPREGGTPLTFDAQSQRTPPQKGEFEKILYCLGNLNQKKQQKHFIDHIPISDEFHLRNRKIQGFIAMGSRQELPIILASTLLHLLEGTLTTDTPNIEPLTTKHWKIYEKKPEEFLWKCLNHYADDKQEIKSMEDRKNQIKAQLKEERIWKIFYREITSDEAQNHDFLSRTLLAWSKLYSQGTETEIEIERKAPSHFLLLVCDTDLLGNRDAIEQWKVKMEESLKRYNLHGALLPLQTSPTINEDLTNWMMDWRIDFSLREQIYDEFNGIEEIPLIMLKNKLFPILKDYPPFRQE